jgi:valyl-tRNA synthetase
MTAADRWILSRLQAVTAEVDRSYEDFQFAKATELLYHFAWDELCDWYLELAKVPLTGGGAQADVTRAVLGRVLDALLRLLHPVIPFVTETLWTALTGRESVVVAEWPKPDASLLDSDAEAQIAAVQRLVTEVRRFRTEQGLADRQKVPARIVGIDAAGLQAHEQSVRALTALTAPGGEFTATASLPTEGVVVELDLAGVIDVTAERRRLERDRAAAEKVRAQSAAKLGNEQFMGKAPAQVVAKVQAQLDTAVADLARIEAQLGALPAGRQ